MTFRLARNRDRLPSSTSKRTVSYAILQVPSTADVVCAFASREGKSGSKFGDVRRLSDCTGCEGGYLGLYVSARPSLWSAYLEENFLSSDELGKRVSSISSGRLNRVVSRSLAAREHFTVGEDRGQ